MCAAGRQYGRRSTLKSWTATGRPAEEGRRAFLAAAAGAPREVRAFCGTPHATGRRVSEAPGSPGTASTRPAGSPCSGAPRSTAEDRRPYTTRWDTTQSGSLEAQRAEAAIAVQALNRMAEFGMPRARRVACPAAGGRRGAAPDLQAGRGPLASRRHRTSGAREAPSATVTGPPLGAITL